MTSLTIREYPATQYCAARVEKVFGSAFFTWFRLFSVCVARVEKVFSSAFFGYYIAMAAKVLLSRLCWERVPNNSHQHFHKEVTRERMAIKNLGVFGYPCEPE